MHCASPLRQLVSRSLGIDRRALACFRITLALTLLSDLITRASDITAFYSDSGVLPRIAYIKIYSRLPTLFSLHLMSGLVAFQAVLFGIALVAAGALLVGHRTRWATFVSWLLLISLHNRNPMVVQGGDVVMRMLLFWSLFLPLGTYLALDVVHSPREGATHSAPLSDGTVSHKPAVQTPATQASSTQACSGQVSAGAPATKSGSTRKRFLPPNSSKPNSSKKRDEASLRDACIPEEQPDLTVDTTLTVQPCFSVATVAILLQVCFIYWFTVALKSDPIWRTEGTALYYALSIDQMVRPLGSALLAYPELLRRLTFLTLNIEAFGPLLALLPFWRLRLMIVGVFWGLHLTMGLCISLGIFPIISVVAWSLFIPSEAWDWLEVSLVAVRQKLVSRQKLFSGMWASQARRRHRELLRRFAQGAPLRTVLTSVGSAAHSREATRTRRENLASQSVAAFFLLYVFCWNMRTLDATNYGWMVPANLKWVGDATRTDQYWGMFAPFPLKDDGWFIAEAHLADNRTVDLLRNGAPLRWMKPLHLSSTYRNLLWQKYFLNLWSLSNRAHRPYYVTYLRRTWNETHSASQRVLALDLIYMREDTLPDYKVSPPQKVVLWHQTD